MISSSLFVYLFTYRYRNKIKTIKGGLVNNIINSNANNNNCRYVYAPKTNGGIVVIQ